MSGGAHVSSEILDVMIHGFQDCASSIASLRGAVRGHIDKCLSAASSIVAKLQAIEQAAASHAAYCRQVYGFCRDRQKYDEETGGYRPSCSCEERDMRRAEEEHYKAFKALEQAQRIFRDMKNEVWNYEQPQGGEGMLNSITDEYIPEATDMLLRLREKVQRYDAFVITGADVGGSSSSTAIQSVQSYKSDNFRKGSERIKTLQEQRKVIFTNYCSRCKCCPCQCENIRELYQRNTR